MSTPPTATPATLAWQRHTPSSSPFVLAGLAARSVAHDTSKAAACIHEVVQQLSCPNADPLDGTALHTLEHSVHAAWPKHVCYCGRGAARAAAPDDACGCKCWSSGSNPCRSPKMQQSQQSLSQSRVPKSPVHRHGLRPDSCVLMYPLHNAPPMSPGFQAVQWLHARMCNHAMSVMHGRIYTPSSCASPGKPKDFASVGITICLLYTSPSPRDRG